MVDNPVTDKLQMEISHFSLVENRAVIYLRGLEEEKAE